MSKKSNKFLNEKLLELVTKDIISNEQYQKALNYFDTKKETKVSTIFSTIGVLLIALSIITLFAINWESIPKELKVIISFIPLVITAIMLFFVMIKDKKALRIYTSIVAPISILATNSLISQVFHIQTEIFELIFTSLIMYLPIAFVLKDHISIVVYGLGTIIYVFQILDTSINENLTLLYVVLLSIPLFSYNYINYKRNIGDSKNIILWVINVIIITMVLFFQEVLRGDVLILYLYMIYFITQTLFKKENGLNNFLHKLFMIFLIISCITPSMLFYVEEIEFGYDTLFLTIITGFFIYLSKAYKNASEYFILLFILLIQYIRMPEEIAFICINLITLALGIYKIIVGNKENSYREIKKGVSLILLLILFRFVNSDLSFSTKSIIFLIAGTGFMIGSKIMKKRIGGKEDER